MRINHRCWCGRSDMLVAMTFEKDGITTAVLYCDNCDNEAAKEVKDEETKARLKDYETKEIPLS